MKYRNFKDEDILFVALAAVALAGLLTLSKKRRFAPRAMNAEPKKHAYLKIKKEILQDYVNGKGKRIKFKFFEDKDGLVKLRFIGSALFDRIIDQTMNTVDSKFETLENIEFGKFKKTTENQRLHDILTREPLTDWVLEPVACEIDSRYVAYDLRNDQPTSSAMAMAVYRINPCPPGC